jgi:hypothetical protein
MPTVARILELAPAACYLAANYAARRNGLFGGTAVSNRQSEMIYMVYKVLKEIYDRDNNYAGLQQVANYLYELLQKFAFKAANIVDGGGGGQVAPITPTTLPLPFYFIVDGTTFIADGASSVTMPVSWEGYNLVFARNGVTQTTVNTEPTYFTYDTSTRLLTITPAAVAGELFAIIPT